MKIRNVFRNREVRKLLDDARADLERALNNPNTSDDHKQKVRKRLEELDLIPVERIMAQISSLNM